MNMLVLNCFCDSLAEKMCRILNVSTPAVVEKGTNYADVLIVAIICLTIWGVAKVAQKTVLDWKEKSVKGEKNGNGNPPNDKPQDNNLKLAEKLLDFLKAQTMEYGDKGEFKSYKSITSPECKMYNEVLACLINAQQEDKKKINVETLKQALQVNENPNKTNNIVVSHEG